MALPSDIATRRKALGLSQEALARRFGVSVMTVHRWESGENAPSPVLRDVIKRWLRRTEKLIPLGDRYNNE